MSNQPAKKDDTKAPLPATGFVVNHPEWGVFVGSAMGLGFWSKQDAAGQDRVPVLLDTALAPEWFGQLWEEIKDQVQFVPVKPDGGTPRVPNASMKACVEAGLEMWLPDGDTDHTQDGDEGEGDAGGDRAQDSHNATEDQPTGFESQRRMSMH